MASKHVVEHHPNWQSVPLFLDAKKFVTDHSAGCGE
ncbi:hypothetical protein X742_25960 [Mesorhizobium sp. LNHC232B00]|nr:hypothetical protein X742_25960 [Mesorhizobium sp. LNHC232B00]